MIHLLIDATTHAIVALVVGRIMYLHGYSQGRAMRGLHRLDQPGYVSTTRADRRRQRRALRLAEEEGTSKDS